MRFSLIIPVYNVERYLRDCLDSVMRQSFTDWEAICIDDGSNDNSIAIMKEYAAKDTRFVCIEKPNGGTASARNRGIEVAHGDYLFFLDSDDWMEPDALLTISKHLDREDVLCFSGKRYIEATKEYRPADQLLEQCYATGMDYYNDNALKPRDFAFVSVVLRVYRREYILNNKLFFDESNSFEDNLWVPQAMYYAGSVKVIPDVLYVYRVREGSKMQDFSLKRKKDLLNVANQLARFFIEKETIDRTIVYCAITHHYQVVFVDANQKEDKALLPLVDWEAYRKVSGSKLRHKVQYSALRISPMLFRVINSVLTGGQGQ